ncbi:MAG: glutamyl-tRNA reductase [Mucilaginibacter sp.]|nr:glutamyl-tRNA reductase [Mucilaginibacter sp.]
MDSFFSHSSYMISVISLNFKRTDLAVRSFFQFTNQELSDVYQGLKGRDGLLGVVILSTCNRTEVHLHYNGLYTAGDVLKYLQTYKGTNIPLTQFDIIPNTEDAVQYIVEVGNGLHSMVCGDKQIMRQMKDAYIISQQNNCMSGVLERVSQAIFRSHKRIINETAYHSGSKSISYLAVDVIKKQLQDNNVAILVIGAGEITADLLKYFSSLKFTNVAIANRTPWKAEILAKKYNYTVAEYDFLPQILAQFRVVISCAAADQIINPAMLSGISNRLFIDLTTFRSITLADDNNLNRLITLDNFTRLKNLTNNDQLAAIDMVKHIISEETNVFLNWKKNRDHMNQRNQLL